MSTVPFPDGAIISDKTIPKQDGQWPNLSTNLLSKEKISSSFPSSCVLLQTLPCSANQSGLHDCLSERKGNNFWQNCNAMPSIKPEICTIKAWENHETVMLQPYAKATT